MFYLGIILLPISSTISGLIFISFIFNKKIFRFKNKYFYQKVFLLFIIYNTFLAPFSINYKYHYIGLIGHYIIYIIFYRILIENKFDYNKLINSIVISGIILSFISYLTFIGFHFNLKLIQIPYLNNEYLFNLSSLELRYKASGINMNPNILGIYLVLSLILSIKKKNIIILIIQFIGIILTGSRGAILSLSIPIIYYIIENKKYILLLLFPLIGYKLSNIFSFEHSTNIQRLNIWQNTINIVKDYPLGIGIMNFDNIYPKYQYSGEKYLYHVHNWYLQTILESGIIGALILFIALFNYIGKLKDNIIKLAFLSFLLFSITDFVLTDNRICFILIILIYLGENKNFSSNYT